MVGELESRRRVRNLSYTGLVNTFVAIIIQSTAAVIALHFDELSYLAKKLFLCVLVTNLVGFLCLMAALWPSRHTSPMAAGILGRAGSVAAAFGSLLMMAIKLLHWFIVPACLVVLAVFVLSFMP